MNWTNTLLPLVSGFLLSILAGLAVIPYLTRLKLGQHIREEGPKSHQKKAGTPTMGGMIFMAGTVLSEAIYRAVTRTLPPVEELLLLGLFISYGFIGFLDDYRKVRLGRNLGLKAREKLALQVLFAALFTWFFADRKTVLLPFLGGEFYLGLLYPLFVIFIIVGIGNGVNLLDGLDGLASGVLVIDLAAYAFVAYQGASALGMDLSPLALAGVGSLLGFLVYNKHPAKVIMGDLGSLSLGALLSGFAVATRTELVLLFLGAMPIIENLSVILQVASFQLTGKRIFKMSPLHHHFELSGWKETTVVYAFWSAAAVFAFIGILSMAYVR